MRSIAMRRVVVQARRVALVPMLLICGCSSMSNTDKGVLAGGGLGAVTGGLIGGATGHPGLGAVAGAAVGGISGGLVGNAVDKSEAKAEEARLVAASATPGPLGLTDVVQLVHQHVSDDIIVSQIRSTGAVYHLSAQDIVWLKQNGVSDPVIREMQMTAGRPPRRVYAAAPVYVVPEPPPPVRIGVGYTYYGGRLH